jgi:hypothetical protein
MRLLGAFAPVVIVAAHSAACNSAPTDAGPPPYHAEFVDDSGDVSPSPFGYPRPDVVRLTVDVANDSVTFQIEFTTGTFDSLTSNTFIRIDTDQNANTGAYSPGLGMDYFIPAQRTVSLGASAAIQRCPGGPICGERTGAVPMHYSASALRITVPLELLGRDNGRMSVRVYAEPPGGTPKDYAPEEGRRALRVGS